MLAVAGMAVGASAGTHAGRSPNLGMLSLARVSGPMHAGRDHGLAAGMPLTAAVGQATAHHALIQHTAAQHAVTHRAAAQHAVSHPATAQHAARHQVRTHRAARPRHLHLYRLFDSVTPSAIPAHRAVATYATGSYAVSRSQLAGRRTVFWIDVTGTDPAASILDVEPGDATPAQAATWAWHRLHQHPHALARIYTMLSWWPAVRAAVHSLPPHMRSQIRWWIADPTGVPHLVPGSDATQWYWGHGYDISTAKPRF